MMKTRYKLTQLCLTIAFTALTWSSAIDAKTNNQLEQPETVIAFGEAQLALNDIAITVEYAHSFEQRARGLMHRADLCAECGMLFEFNRPRVAGFWMKNTLIPLDIAYIDSKGVIADIKPMHPLVLESVPSSRPVKYALEMNQGWFAKKGVRVGDKVRVIKRTLAE